MPSFNGAILYHFTRGLPRQVATNRSFEIMPAKSFLMSRRQVLQGAAGLSAAAALTASPIAALAKAPMLGPAVSTHHRFALGGFEITALYDGAQFIRGLFPAFGAEQFEEDVAEVATKNFIPGNGFELPYTPIIVNTGNELVLFDTGNGEARRPSRGKLLSSLKAAGYAPEQIDMIVLTHYHPDHVGGLIEDGNPVFPNARYVAGATEHNFWTPMELVESGGSLARRAKVVQEQVVPLNAKITFLKEGQDVVSGISAIASPGHTPGHLAFHIESNKKRLLLWGDAIVHYVMSFQKPDWQLASDMDHEVAIKTRMNLLGMAAADKIPVTGYHLPFPSIGYVEKMGDAFRFVPASYQFRT